KVRIYVSNKLPEPTTVHWHGMITPNGMDGVGGLSQKAIAPGETYKYEFVLRQAGTLMYHSHHDEMTQMGMGLTGLFIIHPRNPSAPPPDRDFAILLHEWRIDVGTSRPNPNEMSDFNILTMNGKVFPATQPLIVRRGDRVRIRLGNLSAMEHHPIHLHGYRFRVTEFTEGPLPEAAQFEEGTILVPVGATRTVEFVADNPGDWAFHCHMTHHVMNQMGHQFPNMIGVDTAGIDDKLHDALPGFMMMGQAGMAGMGEMAMRKPANSIPMLGGRGPHDYITMGGMFTILKVREKLDSYDEDPGWYENPAGTLATLASAEDFSANGIAQDLSDAPSAPPHAIRPWPLAESGGSKSHHMPGV
ncbi:MAG TPA: multicopper oxidase domain-containing protein, partial [Pirellulales bacterium]